LTGRDIGFVIGGFEKNEVLRRGSAAVDLSNPLYLIHIWLFVRAIPGQLEGGVYAIDSEYTRDN
jgi:hypothetical protein